MNVVMNERTMSGHVLLTVAQSRRACWQSYRKQTAVRMDGGKERTESGGGKARERVEERKRGRNVGWSEGECVARCHRGGFVHRCTLWEGNTISCDLSTSSEDPPLRPWRAQLAYAMNHPEEMMCTYRRSETDKCKPACVHRSLKPRAIVRAFESLCCTWSRLLAIFATRRIFLRSFACAHKPSRFFPTRSMKFHSALYFRYIILGIYYLNAKIIINEHQIN